MKGRLAGLLMIASAILGVMGAGSLVASLFVLLGPAPHPSALAVGLTGLVAFAAALGSMAWARHLGPAAGQVLLAIHVGRARGVRNLQRRGRR